MNEPGGAAALWELLRPPQWLKNGLVVAPLVFGGRLLDPPAIVAAGLAFVAFCLAASASYAFNDLHDLEADRAHPTKRRRPLAAGRVTPRATRLLAAGLALAAAVLAARLGSGFALVLGAYVLVSILYTLLLKRFAVLDVLTIGALFVLRVVGGAVAVDVVASDWILIATGLLAVFLGLCKRRHELVLLGDAAGDHRESLGDYTAPFLDAAISLTTSAALLTYLLYARDPETVARVGSPGLLLGGPFVLYGLLRYLQLTYSRGSGADPTEVLISDPGVIAAGLGFIAVCGLVLYL